MRIEATSPLYRLASACQANFNVRAEPTDILLQRLKRAVLRAPCLATVPEQHMRVSNMHTHDPKDKTAASDPQNPWPNKASVRFNVHEHHVRSAARAAAQRARDQTIASSPRLVERCGDWAGRPGEDARKTTDGLLFIIQEPHFMFQEAVIDTGNRRLVRAWTAVVRIACTGEMYISAPVVHGAASEKIDGVLEILDEIKWAPDECAQNRFLRDTLATLPVGRHGHRAVTNAAGHVTYAPTLAVP
jgi:hypothetical protein